MRPDITVALILIGIFLIPYSVGDPEIESFDDILKKYKPDIALPKEDEEMLQKLPPSEWKAAVIRYKDLHAKNKVLQNENNELQLKSPVYHFHCAVTKAKNLLQFFTTLICNYRINHLLTIPALDIILIDAQSKYDKQFTDVDKFTNEVSKWYYFIQETKDSFAKRIKKNLELYQKEHLNAYPNIDDLYLVFCASVARSSYLFNYLHHAFLMRMENEDFDDDEDAFYKFLRTTSPFYYFDVTDVTFLNIVVISFSISDKINEKKLFTYVKTELKPTIFNTHTAYNSRIIVLPQSIDCPSLKIDSTHKALPFSVSKPYQ